MNRPATLQEAERLYDQNVFLRWRFNIRLQAELASYALARGDLTQAASYAMASLQQAEQVMARKHMAWAHKLLGDIATLEERLEDSRRELATALGILESHPCPVIEWKILKATAALAKRQKDDSAHEEFLGRSHAVIQSLADSVHDDKLRRTFLASQPVRDL